MDASLIVPKSQRAAAAAAAMEAVEEEEAALVEPAQVALAEQLAAPCHKRHSPRTLVRHWLRLVRRTWATTC